MWQRLATPFELRPIGVELQLCQRYYEVIRTNPITVNMGYYPSGGASNLIILFKTTKRFTPTIVSSNTVTAGAGTLGGIVITIDSVAYQITSNPSGFFFYNINNDLRLDAEL
jgi:hypothetical protein